MRVGHTTLVGDEGVAGRGPVRTGVTVVLPKPGRIWEHPVFAGCHRLNGNGELTGLEWIRESGLLGTPIALTNTHSVGVVRDALVAHEAAQRGPDADFWALPVVGETWDGRLNDVNGQHVLSDHVHAAIASAASGPVAEGNVGGGTGVICHGFKGGIGTASRVVRDEYGSYTLGVLLQANHGRRARFTVEGVPVGMILDSDRIPLPGRPFIDRGLPEGSGSVIAILATDAPLLPHQCDRVAQRAGLGIARLGAAGEHFSGDLFLCFATGNESLPGDHTDLASGEVPLTMLPDARISGLFAAAVDATEEAVLNALLAARTMTGRNDVTAHELPPESLLEALRTYEGGARGPG